MKTEFKLGWYQLSKTQQNMMNDWWVYIEYKTLREDKFNYFASTFCQHKDKDIEWHSFGDCVAIDHKGHSSKFTLVPEQYVSSSKLIRYRVSRTTEVPVTSRVGNETRIQMTPLHYFDYIDYQEGIPNETNE